MVTDSSMILMLVSIATSLRSIADSMATPCSVKAYGRYLLPPHVLEVTDRDLKRANSSSVRRKRKRS